MLGAWLGVRLIVVVPVSVPPAFPSLHVAVIVYDGVVSASNFHEVV